MSDHIPDSVIEGVTLDPVSNPVEIFEFSESTIDNPFIQVRTGRDFIVKDDLSVEGQLYHKPSRIKAWQSSAQSINDNSTTKVLFQTEDFDELEEFVDSTFTVKHSGYYLINTQVTVDNLNPGDYLRVIIYKNGNAYAFHGVHANATTLLTTAVTSIVDLTVGDTIEVYVRHNYGSARNLSTGKRYTYVEAHTLSLDY